MQSGIRVLLPNRFLNFPQNRHEEPVRCLSEQKRNYGDTNKIENESTGADRT